MCSGISLWFSIFFWLKNQTIILPGKGKAGPMDWFLWWCGHLSCFLSRCPESFHIFSTFWECPTLWIWLPEARNPFSQPSSQLCAGVCPALCQLSAPHFQEIFIFREFWKDRREKSVRNPEPSLYPQRLFTQAWSFPPHSPPLCGYVAYFICKCCGIRIRILSERAERILRQPVKSILMWLAVEVLAETPGWH